MTDGTSDMGTQEPTPQDGLEITQLQREIVELRQRLAELPKRTQVIETRLLETKGRLSQTEAHNEKLTLSLKETRNQVASLRAEVDKLSQPPSAYGVVLGLNDDNTIDVLTSGRKMRVNSTPEIDRDELVRGAEVVLNESLNIVVARRPESTGK